MPSYAILFVFVSGFILAYLLFNYISNLSFFTGKTKEGVLSKMLQDNKVMAFDHQGVLSITSEFR